MKYTDTLSKAIVVYWIAVICMAAFYAFESFADFFNGNEDFTYRIILRVFALIAIISVLVNLTIGLFKKVSNSLGLLKILARYSYVIGLLGLITLILHITRIVISRDAYLFGGVCGFIALSGYLSSLWFNRNYQTLPLE